MIAKFISGKPGLMIFPLLKLTKRKSMVKVLLNLHTCIQGVMYHIVSTLNCTKVHLRVFLLLGGGVLGVKKTHHTYFLVNIYTG